MDNPARHPLKLLALVTCSILLAAGCTAGGDDSPDPTPTEATATATATATPATPEATGSPACSASGMPAEVAELEGLPAEVATMRAEIVAAAVACEYEKLQELAFRPGGSFQYSTEEESAGPDAQPAAFWQAQEQAGERPMAALVELLSTQPGVQQVTEPEGPGSGSEDSYYNWPAEGASDEGYRTSITSRGDWIFFIKSG